MLLFLWVLVLALVWVGEKSIVGGMGWNFEREDYTMVVGKNGMSRSLEAHLDLADMYSWWNIIDSRPTERCRDHLPPRLIGRCSRPRPYSYKEVASQICGEMVYSTNHHNEIDDLYPIHSKVQVLREYKDKVGYISTNPIYGTVYLTYQWTKFVQPNPHPSYASADHLPCKWRSPLPVSHHITSPLFRLPISTILKWHHDVPHIEPYPTLAQSLYKVTYDSTVGRCDRRTTSYTSPTFLLFCP